MVASVVPAVTPDRRSVWARTESTEVAASVARLAPEERVETALRELRGIRTEAPVATVVGPVKTREQAASRAPAARAERMVRPAPTEPAVRAVTAARAYRATLVRTPVPVWLLSRVPPEVTEATEATEQLHVQRVRPVPVEMVARAHLVEPVGSVLLRWISPTVRRAETVVLAEPAVAAARQVLVRRLPEREEAVEQVDQAAVEVSPQLVATVVPVATVALVETVAPAVSPFRVPH